MEARHTRALRLAGGVSDHSEETLLGRMGRSRVVVSVAPDPVSIKTAEVLVDTLRRLPLRLAIDPRRSGVGPGQVDRLVDVAIAIDPDRGMQVARAEADSDVIVAVGGGDPAPTVGGVPVRHGALVVSGSSAGDPGADVSGLGVFTCAALLAGEVFKRVAAVRPERASLPRRLAWCPVALGEDPWSTPVLERPPEFDVALVGQGAIGTATTRILALLGAEGRAQLVDPERFAPENLGTYSLGCASDADRGPWKVDLGAAALPGMTTETYVGRAADFIGEVDGGRAAWPSVVLTGLDSIPARREVQRLWPDRLIDGATGDTMCGLHDVAVGGSACLMCLFPERRDGPGAAERLAAATGLSTNVAAHGDRLLEEGDIAQLDKGRRELLEPLLGKPICGIAQAVGLTELDPDGYRPSVPFVSQQAACMAVGRLLSDLIARDDERPTFVQYDALVGPGEATLEARRPRPGCYCQERAGLIDAVRRERRRKR
jgi:hypothetical protein